MPANDEFPRGVWLFSGIVTNGTAATVTFPATPGISWVLKEIDAVVYAVGTGAQTFGPVITVNNISYIFLAVSAQAASSNQLIKDSGSWSGSYQFDMGGAVVITFSAVSSIANGEMVSAYAEPV